MSALYGGIDLGLRGGVAITGQKLSTLAQLVPIVGTPSSPSDYDFDAIEGIAVLLRSCLLVAMEAAATVRVPRRDKRTGRTTMIVEPRATQALAYSRGVWTSALRRHGVPFVEVPARRWQAAKLKGIPGGDTKARACAYVRSVWPDVDLRPGRFTTDQDGIADALMLAEYARGLARRGSGASVARTS